MRVCKFARLSCVYVLTLICKGTNHSLSSKSLKETGLLLIMTQQEQQDFQDNLDAALFWMQAVQDRLRTNDNTQGPRSNLEARLRETEKILESEHEGRVKMDMVLVGAEILLRKGDEEMNNHIHTKLKDLKVLWEETTTYVIHCHSRIEWVWLHWSEYLKAYQEFELWMTCQQRSLDTGLELQVGAREKLWQVDHQRVVVSDVCSQGVLLERLLDESATLHNRTQDPSVDPHAQKKLQEAYNNIRDRAEERLVLLQKIAEEHQMYHSCVLKFKLWLQLKIDELHYLVESETSAEDQLKALQILKDSAASEEKSLQHIECMADAIRVNTSPAGAELLIKETDEVRLGWQNLWQGLSVSGEGFRSNLDSCSLYFTRCQCLAESISHLRTLFQKLKQELEESETRDKGERTEDLMVDRWRKYMGVRNALSVQEPQVEHLKAQLKELFRFSHDSRHLSDEVLTVVKEHQSVKVRALKLCSDAENGLRQVLQEPFHSFTQWSQLVCQVLDDSADVSDSSHIDMQIQRIEKLIKHSAALEERLSLLQVKRDLLGSLFGSEKTESLLSELSTAITNRELLHNQLVQRKSIMQGLIARIKDFGAAYESICTKLMVLKKQLISADCLQPDILAKKSQCDQLMVIMKDLEDCEVHIVAMETLGPLSSDNRTKFERLHKDWQLLYKTVKVKVSESEASITEHQSFHENILTVEKWLMTMRQRLESYCSPSGEWSIENRQHEAERALGEFPEKELQLHSTETQGNAVLERTSKEGMAHILGDMKRLRESWISLHDLSLYLYRLLTNHDSSEHLNSDLWVEGGRCHSIGNLRPAHNISVGEAESQDSDSMQHRERYPKGYSGESHFALASEKLEVLSARKLNRGADEGSIVCMEKRKILGHGVGILVYEGLDSSLEGYSELATQDTQKCGNSLPMTTEVKVGSEVKEHPFAVVEVDSSKWGQSQNETGQTIPSSMGGTVCSVSSTTLQSCREMGLSAVDIGQTEKCVDKQVEGAAEPPAATRDIHHSQGSGVSFREKDLEMDDRRGRDSGALTPVQQTKQGLTVQHGVLAGSPIQLSSQNTVVLSAKDYESRRQEFEAWLCSQNKLLSGILHTKRKLAAKDIRFRQDTFKSLKAGVARGQEQFELLVQEGKCPRSSSGTHLEEDVNLEELRYRWMLYKSKLKDMEDVKAQLDHNVRGCDVRQRPAEDTLHQKKPPGLLYRVCSLALPFQLLLLLLLLLAFLLPFMDGGASCSLSNNFARSFNVMLRYNGPPPT